MAEARSAWRSWLLAATFAAASLLALSPAPKRLNLFNIDQPRYLSIAHGLLSHGVFGDGREPAVLGATPDPAQPGAAVAPLYPALLAGLARLDPTLRAAAACVAGAADEAAIRACPPHLGVVVPLQLALAATTLLLIRQLARAATGSETAGWSALAFAGLATGQYAVFAWTAMTEALIAPLLAFLLLGLVRLAQGAGPGWSIASGAALGAVLLTRPEYEALAWAVLLVGGALVVVRRSGGRLVLLAGTALLITVPWQLRNFAVTGHAGLTWGYGGFVLAQRMAYQAMSLREWLAGWVHALPGFGPSLARHLFGAADVARLGWEERPDTFYMVGNTVMLDELRQHAPSPDGQVGYLLRRYVLPDPAWYALVSLMIAWKTLWVRKFVGLVGVPLLAWLVARAVCRRDRVVLAAAAPGLFMALLYGAVSVGTPRYDLGLMMPLYALAVGAAAAPWIEALRRRLFPRSEPRLEEAAQDG